MRLSLSLSEQFESICSVLCACQWKSDVSTESNMAESKMAEFKMAAMTQFESNEIEFESE